LSVLGPKPLVVTAVVPVPRRRGRVSIYVNGDPACELARKSVSQHRIRPGHVLAPGELDAIVAADRRRYAFECTTAMLARRPRSERDIRRRLRQRKLDADVVEQTIARLHELRLLDDAEYARSWAEARDRSSPRSRRLIARELRASGVDGETADRATADISDDDAAYRLESRHAASFAAEGYERFAARLASRLRSRGFGWDVTRRTVGRCWREVGISSETAGDDFAADDLEVGVR
jgi:regulatory protein